MRMIVVGALPLALIACAPEPKGTPGPKSEAAPCIELVATHYREERQHAAAARTKMSARDGKGCLAELDTYDRLDPWMSGLSTNAESPMAITRATCQMLAGECTIGKALYRQAIVHNAGAILGAENLDRSTDLMAAIYCQGNALTPRDELLRALADLQQGAYVKTKDSESCMEAYRAARRVLSNVQPAGENDEQILRAMDQVRVSAPECFARAGDCEKAKEVFTEVWSADRKFNDSTLHQMFQTGVRRCAEK